MNPQQRRRKQIEDGLTDAELEAEDDREADRYMRDLEARLNFTEKQNDRATDEKNPTRQRHRR